MQQRGRTGFTLAEILVCLGLIGLLAGVLLPVAASAKTRSKHAVDISNLHQIVIGSQLYAEQAGTVLGQAEQLTQSGLLPTSVFASPLDGSADGLGNELRIRYRRISKAEFKLSYTGILDLNGLQPSNRLAESRGGGIWISQTISQRKAPSEAAYVGAYMRALTEGSVVYRQIRWRSYSSGRRGEWTAGSWLFTDDEQLIGEVRDVG